MFLNVWTPEPAPASPLPVMVWLPGGGNQNGAASDLSVLSGGTHIYDGRDLASSRNVVVVTINYRVGVMGFFAHAGLRSEGGVSGNQGLADQQLALRWVQENIRAFGGDSDNVTLFGESAGAQDTCLQIVSPSARGLFHRAVGQSGGCVTYRNEAAEAEQQVEAFAQAVGCADAADELVCLRGKSAAELLISAPVDGGMPGAPGGSRFNGGSARWEFDPIVDGTLIPAQPRALVEAGDFAKVPYLLGSNFEEGRLFMLAAMPPVATEAEYLAALERTFGASAPAVAAMYPPERLRFGPRRARSRVGRLSARLLHDRHRAADRVERRPRLRFQLRSTHSGARGARGDARCRAALCFRHTCRSSRRGHGAERRDAGLLDSLREGRRSERRRRTRVARVRGRAAGADEPRCRAIGHLELPQR